MFSIFFSLLHENFTCSSEGIERRQLGCNWQPWFIPLLVVPHLCKKNSDCISTRLCKEAVKAVSLHTSTLLVSPTHSCHVQSRYLVHLWVYVCACGDAFTCSLDAAKVFSTLAKDRAINWTVKIRVSPLWSSHSLSACCNSMNATGRPQNNIRHIIDVLLAC